MSFQDAIATQPMWVRIWVTWMAIAIVGTVVILLFSPKTRRDALIIFLTMAVTAPAMEWFYRTVGYVRLLGLVHVVFWTPLALYIWRRLRTSAVLSPYRQVMWVLLATMVVSLCFDYVDVVRYLLGERESLIGT